MYFSNWFDKRRLWLLVPLFFLTTVFNSKGQPTISSFSPLSGETGTTVTISGTNFSSTPANNIVYFGGVKANVTASSTTSISATVPVSATYAPISATTNNLTAYSKLPFTVTFPATSTDFTNSSFAAKVDFFVTSAGSQGSSVSDLDNDGKNELIYAYGDNKSVSLSKNQSTNSTIGFEPRQSYSVGNYSYATVVADFDGDGLLDIADAKASGTSFEYVYGELSVMRNTTSGGVISMSARIDLLASEPEKLWYWIAADDLDRDGKPDIVITNNSVPGRIAIFRNTSVPGTLSFEAPVKYTTGNSPRVVTTGDIDNDGKSDILVANQGSASFSIFRNLSTPGVISFAGIQSFSTRSSSLYLEAVRVGDLDSDGDLDILVTDHFYPNPGTLSIFQNNSTPGNISLGARVDLITSMDPWDIAFSDFNGDGKPDVAVSSDFSNAVTVYKNQSSGGTITLTPQVTYSGFDGARDILAADMNGDGQPEIILRNYSGTQFSILKNEVPIVVLPLTMLHFSGHQKSSEVVLKWITTNESMISHFVIEHAVNGADFSKIGTTGVTPGANATKEYSFIDKSPAKGDNFYRLKIMDLDGKFAYSKIVKVRIREDGLFIIAPNPAKDLVTLRHPPGNNMKLVITDAAGKMLKSLSIENNSLETKLNISSLPSGIYTLSVHTGKSLIQKKLLKID